MKRLTYLGFAIALSAVLGVSAATAQTQPQPATPDQTDLGAYARKVRKDTAPAKERPKVYDNDNIPKDDTLSVVGPQPSGNAPQAGDNSGAEKSAGSPEEDPAKKESDWKEWQKKIAAQKDQIDLMTRELDVLQGEYKLRAAAMYADAGNRLRNQVQWDKQDADYKQKIADKQKALDDAKKSLEDLQEQARKAGVPSGMREP